jgi:hypothetical protein
MIDIGGINKKRKGHLSPEPDIYHLPPSRTPCFSSVTTFKVIVIKSPFIVRYGTVTVFQAKLSIEMSITDVGKLLQENNCYFVIY